MSLSFSAGFWRLRPQALGPGPERHSGFERAGALDFWSVFKKLRKVVVYTIFSIFPKETSEIVYTTGISDFLWKAGWCIHFLLFFQAKPAKSYTPPGFFKKLEIHAVGVQFRAVFHPGLAVGVSLSLLGHVAMCA